MNEHRLNIGEVKTFDRAVMLTCLGLGSCIGLFVQDRATGISGGAHILLPGGATDREIQRPGYHVQQAIEELLSQFRQRGSSLQALRAKLAGGANVLNLSLNMGQQNAKAVIEQLIQNKIYIAATDVGGTENRTARYHGQNGLMYVRTAANSEYRIY